MKKSLQIIKINFWIGACGHSYVWSCVYGKLIFLCSTIQVYYGFSMGLDLCEKSPENCSPLIPLALRLDFHVHYSFKITPNVFFSYFVLHFHIFVLNYCFIWLFLCHFYNYSTKNFQVYVLHFMSYIIIPCIWNSKSKRIMWVYQSKHSVLKFMISKESKLGILKY